MAFSLYAATVPSYRQILGSVRQLIDTAAAHCGTQGIAPAELIEARLAPDMFPFGYQVKSTTVHSLGAIEAARRGEFSPDRSPFPQSFEALGTRVTGALEALEAIAPADIDALIGRDMRFVAGERRIEFKAEDFLLSFAQPNFYFHAATAYDILRWKGLPIGKRDFMGVLRAKS